MTNKLADLIVLILIPMLLKYRTKQVGKFRGAVEEFKEVNFPTQEIFMKIEQFKNRVRVVDIVLASCFGYTYYDVGVTEHLGTTNMQNYVKKRMDQLEEVDIDPEIFRYKKKD